MKTQFLNLLLVVVWGIGIQGSLVAQGMKPDSASSATHSQLPPLSKVIEAAIRNSPRVKREQASVNQRDAELSVTKKRWLQSLNVEGNSQYGSYGDQTSSQLYLGNRIGVSLRVSLFDIFSHGNAVNEYEFQKQTAEYTRKTMEQELRQIVIERYSAVTLNCRLVEITGAAQTVAYTHQVMAEQEFKRGEIPLSELSRIGQVAAEASIRFETSRSEYTSAYAILENLAGEPLSNLEPR